MLITESSLRFYLLTRAALIQGNYAQAKSYAQQASAQPSKPTTGGSWPTA